MKRKDNRTPEGIPAIFLANTITSLLHPLSIIFNLSLISSKIPSQWKLAFIIPVFKKGDRRKVGNYRPISLTSSISRLFEAVLLNKLQPFVIQNNSISKFQFGFLPNRTLCGNMLSSLYPWCVSYSSSKSTNILYTDIKKAFDSVNHRFLVHILHSFGISIEVIKWLENFLADRQQMVCINNSLSPPLAVHSGVPQGSVIAPFLFLLFINGIADGPCSSQSVDIRLFADDSKLFSNAPDDLQQAIDEADQWLSQRQLCLAPQKCAILKIKKASVTDSSQFYINSHSVKEVQQFRDLGILVSSDLKWSSHISSITHSASVTSYQFRKFIKSKNIWTWIQLYKTYIRPKLEFNTTIWSPFLLKDINKLESIQRKFTKFAFKKCSIPFENYKSRLYMINMLSLKSRRIFFDLILMYKIINNISDLTFDNYFQLIKTNYSLRSHSFQIKPKLYINSTQFQNSFFGRIPSLWNSLPTEVVESTSLDSFKKLLNLHLLQNQI